MVSLLSSRSTLRCHTWMAYGALNRTSRTRTRTRTKSFFLMFFRCGAFWHAQLEREASVCVHIQSINRRICAHKNAASSVLTTQKYMNNIFVSLALEIEWVRRNGVWDRDAWSSLFELKMVLEKMGSASNPFISSEQHIKGTNASFHFGSILPFILEINMQSMRDARERWTIFSITFPGPWNKKHIHSQMEDPMKYDYWFTVSFCIGTVLNVNGCLSIR